MHERTKELEAEAYAFVSKQIQRDHFNTDAAYNWHCRIAFNEKFAELIVQECIAHIEEDRFYKVNLSETSYNTGYVDGMDRAESILKEHFGVE